MCAKQNYFSIQVQNGALMITSTSWYDQPLQACPGVPIFEGYVESWEKKLTIMQLFDVFTKSFRPQSDFLIFFKKLGIITIGQPKRKYFQNLFSGSWKVSLVLFAACSIKLVENRVAYLLSWHLVQCTLFFLLGLLIGGSFIAVMAHVWNTYSRFVLGSNL